MTRKILVMGLPGAGKTTLSLVLAKRLGAVHFNADAVRHNLNKDLGFSPEDRVEQARRMGWLADQVVKAGGFAIADFVCPTPEARGAFLEDGPSFAAFIVWVNRITEGRFPDTNKLFVPPARYDIEITPEGTPEYWAEKIAAMVRPVFDPQKPTALFIGRYQPFHDGHRALIVEGMRRVGQALIAVRNLPTDHKNPFPFEYVRARIEQSLREYEGRFQIIPVPNISHVFWGRDVGWKAEQIDLDQATQRISATALRKRMAG